MCLAYPENIFYLCQMKSFLSLLIACILLCSCGWLDTEPTVYNTEGLLKNADCLTYEELPDHVRGIATDAHVFAAGGDPQETIKKEQGYYVQVILDNEILAKASVQDTNWRPLLDPANNRALYAKYTSKPHFFDATNKEIKGTMKHGAHDLLFVARNGRTDTVYWGPERSPVARVVISTKADSSAHTTFFIKPRQ